MISFHFRFRAKDKNICLATLLLKLSLLQSTNALAAQQLQRWTQPRSASMYEKLCYQQTILNLSNFNNN